MATDDELEPYLRALEEATGRPVAKPEWLERFEAEQQQLRDAVSRRAQGYGAAWEQVLRLAARTASE